MRDKAMLLHQKVTNFNADLTHKRLKITTQHPIENFLNRKALKYESGFDSQ